MLQFPNWLPGQTRKPPQSPFCGGFSCPDFSPQCKILQSVQNLARQSSIETVLGFPILTVEGLRPSEPQTRKQKTVK